VYGKKKENSEKENIVANQEKYVLVKNAKLIENVTLLEKLLKFQ
jgi:hypothetical protein